jgi:hypothetical protein
VAEVARDTRAIFGRCKILNVRKQGWTTFQTLQHATLDRFRLEASLVMPIIVRSCLSNFVAGDCIVLVLLSILYLLLKPAPQKHHHVDLAFFQWMANT